MSPDGAAVKNSNVRWNLHQLGVFDQVSKSGMLRSTRSSNASVIRSLTASYSALRRRQARRYTPSASYRTAER